MADQLQELADQIRDARPATLTPEGRWTDATLALYAQLADAIEATGEPRRLAELAVMGWIITGEPIGRCIEQTRSEGYWQQPPPARDRHGFGPAAQLPLTSQLDEPQVRR